MKKFLVIAAAGGALAIGVPAAFAVTDSPTTQTIQQQSTPTPAAPQDQERERGGRDDCPEKDGNGASGQQGAAPQGGSATTTPSPEL